MALELHMDSSYTNVSAFLLIDSFSIVYCSKCKELALLLWAPHCASAEHKWCWSSHVHMLFWEYSIQCQRTQWEPYVRQRGGAYQSESCPLQIFRVVGWHFSAYVFPTNAHICFKFV